MKTWWQRAHKTSPRLHGPSAEWQGRPRPRPPCAAPSKTVKTADLLWFWSKLPTCDFPSRRCSATSRRLPQLCPPHIAARQLAHRRILPICPTHQSTAPTIHIIISIHSGPFCTLPLVAARALGHGQRSSRVRTRGGRPGHPIASTATSISRNHEALHLSFML